MRTITNATIQSLNSPNGAYVLPIFLEIDHEDLASPIRVVNNKVNLTFEGEVFTATKFVYQPPSLREDGTVSNASIQISAISQNQLFTEKLRSITTPLTVKAVAVFWPDTGVIEPVASWTMRLIKAVGNLEYISGELEFENKLKNQIPGRIVRPATYPGAFI